MIKTFFPKILFIIFTALLSFQTADAATLSASPSTGVYTTGSNFTVTVLVNTESKSINAAEGVLTYNPKELSVVAVNRNSSIFNLWVTEPTFSNTAGTINFSGGLPSGYAGSAGTVFTVTFRPILAGTPRISFTGGSVLANDGQGTNVLSKMSGGTYTVKAPSDQPKAEVIEYVAPANTPATPKISSPTHPDSSAWYTQNKAVLNWDVPAEVVAVRTLIDDLPSSVPTKIYDTPIKTITIADLKEGESYFHIQFKNNEGWGRVAHYRLGVDTLDPQEFTITLAPDSDGSNPVHVLSLITKDSADASPVNRYKVKIDNGEEYEYIDEKFTKQIILPTLNPGNHLVVIEAYDAAGNSAVNTFSFTITAFAKPIFTDYPNQINEEVIPVIKGTTRPGAEVVLELTKVGSEAVIYKVTANESGQFIFIPEGTLSQGVYELNAHSVDVNGARSETSDIIRIAVQQPGFIQIGNKLISVLSVLVPLVAMSIILILSFWGLFIYLKRLRKKVAVESTEADQILNREFQDLSKKFKVHEEVLINSKKAKKLNETEQAIFAEMYTSLDDARVRILKEIVDVEKLVQREDKE
jgi:Cohesin domain/Bacterial Ig-like domain